MKQTDIEGFQARLSVLKAGGQVQLTISGPQGWQMTTLGPEGVAELLRALDPPPRPPLGESHVLKTEDGKVCLDPEPAGVVLRVDADAGGWKATRLDMSRLEALIRVLELARANLWGRLMSARSTEPPAGPT